MLSIDDQERELAYRLDLWQRLAMAGGPKNVSPDLLKQLRIQVGQQGVFRDRERTSLIGKTSSGIAVGARHTGRVYADDLNDDGLTYHYPKTDRGQRDANEIASLKACYENVLPIFVVITPTPNASTRDVRLGWVVDYNDRAGELLVSFAQEPPRRGESAVADSPFNLFEARPTKRTYAKTRPNQWRFHFDVMKRYGAQCAVCDLLPPLVQAAHLCSVEAGGSDDARNGLVLCLNHHRAFDLGLFRINPYDLSVSGPDTLGLKRISISHLPQLPHQDALVWAWERALDFQKIDIAGTLQTFFAPCAEPG